MSVLEEWKEIFDGYYEVSSFGNVRRSKPGRRTCVGRVLSPIALKIGYLAVRPVVDGNNVQRYVHRLVADAFLGPCPAGEEVNHIDGVKTNNTVSNLEYVTHAGNMRHARASGLSPVGSRCNRGHIVESDVVAMRIARESGESLSSVALRFGMSKSATSQICNHVRWRHVS